MPKKIHSFCFKCIHLPLNWIQAYFITLLPGEQAFSFDRERQPFPLCSLDRGGGWDYNKNAGKNLQKVCYSLQEMGKVYRYMNEQEKRSASSYRMDEMRFEALYAAYANDVLRMSYFYLGDRQKAEDVTQDVFLKLYTANPELLEGKEKAWLLKVALNKCRDVWRAAWVKRVVLGSPAMDLAPAPGNMEDNLERQELMQAIHKLPADFRDVVLLHYYQGLGIAEIAAMLKVPEGTISSRLSRGRKKLEAILKESGLR